MRDRLLAELPDATLLTRAPGRVNLIGEHTDYNGFPVLPMAIDRSLWLAAAPRPEPVVTIRSLVPERYPTVRLALAELPERPPGGTWADYVVAALRQCPPPDGIELVVAGDVPPEAGLSSSSALVVASFLVVAAPGDGTGRAALAERARRAERYVGTLSGGMDQAISLLGRSGYALKIEFRPVRAGAVPVPEHIGVVVAHSGVQAAKSGAAREAYNSRVNECAAAAAELGAPADGLLADVPAERRPAAERLGNPVLRRRARFVFEEAERVEAAANALESGDLAALGALVNASHRGLRDDYEVSHPAVDALVDRALAAGASGARVVGAGFGGCVVSVCAADRAEALREALGPEAWVFRPAAGAERVEL